MISKKYKHLYNISVVMGHHPNFILASDTFETEYDALRYGKKILIDYCYEKLYGNLSKVIPDNCPENITLEQFKKWIDYELMDEKNYYLNINVISTERKIFNYNYEIKEYFEANIKNISNMDLYDFLLSLVDREIRQYDCFGNLIFKTIITNIPLLEKGSHQIIDFNEDDCNNGIYEFKYF